MAGRDVHALQSAFATVNLKNAAVRIVAFVFARGNGCGHVADLGIGLVDRIVIRFRPFDRLEDRARELDRPPYPFRLGQEISSRFEWGGCIIPGCRPFRIDVEGQVRQAACRRENCRVLSKAAAEL